MIRLSTEKVLALHAMVARATGGSVGLRDEGLLDSALETAFSGFGGQEFYPTIEEKAARLGHSLIANHAFVDGNKRIGIFVMLTFLQVNDVTLNITNQDVIDTALGVAAGRMDYDALLAWIRAHRA